MARRQKARPQCLRPHPRGVRGEAEGVNCRDEAEIVEAQRLKDMGEGDGSPLEGKEGKRARKVEK